MSLQPFKETDETEAKFTAAALPALEDLGGERDTFYADAFEAFPLGDVLYELERDPMVGVITPEIFRSSFFAIHELFTRPGTFEFYLEVFRAIWGEAVDVEFVVPAPGKLLINIAELAPTTFNLMVRRIVSDVYVYEALKTTTALDQIVIQDVQGTKNETEVDALINEIAPGGIWIVSTLETGP